jgi:hypothetical protein
VKRLISFLLVLALAAPLAASQVQVKTFEQLTVAGTAVGITAAILSPDGQQQINRCSVRLETAQIRYRWDGTNPTASVGTILDVGETLPINGFDVAQSIRFIRTGSTSGVLDVECWK